MKPPQLKGTDPRSKKKYYLHQTLISRITFFLFGIFVFLTMKLRVVGLENFPKEGSFVLAANHLTNLDAFLMIYTMPRPIFFMTKMEAFRNPIGDLIFRHLGGFPVRRDNIDRWALKQALHVLAQQKVLGIFPEGGRSKGMGLTAGKVGPAYLAIKSGSPLVPLAITGSPQVFKKFPWRTSVTIEVGEPIYPEPKASPQVVTERLMLAIAAMLPREMRGVYQAQVEEVVS